MMLASIVLPRPTSSARMARPPIWRSTRWATSIWWGSSLIALASSVISRSNPGTSAIRSASRRRSYQARSGGAPRNCSANTLSERSSTDQTSSAGGVAGGADGGGRGGGCGMVARRVGGGGGSQYSTGGPPLQAVKSATSTRDPMHSHISTILCLFLAVSPSLAQTHPPCGGDSRRSLPGTKVDKSDLTDSVTLAVRLL